MIVIIGKQKKGCFLNNIFESLVSQSLGRSEAPNRIVRLSLIPLQNKAECKSILRFKNHF